MNNKYIGTSGWSYSGWQKSAIPSKNTFYKDKCNIQEYATHFNMVELNTTFYKQPSVATVKKWREQVPETFRYLVKVNKYLTHSKKLIDWESLFPDFYLTMSHLEDKLLGFVIQLPPSFQNTDKNRERILKVAKWSKKNYSTEDFYVEFRHSSWFCKETFTLLRGFWNVVIVHSSFFDFDVLSLWNSVGDNKPDKTMFRLHGTWKSQVYCGDYSDEQLVFIASCLDHGGIVAFNNTDSLQGQLQTPFVGGRGPTLFSYAGDTVLPSAVNDAKRLQILCK